MSAETIRQALRRAKEVHFLIELAFSGRTYRVGTKGVSFSDRRFSELLTSVGEAGSNFSIRDLRYSMGSLACVMSNRDRLQDWRLTSELENGIGTVYLWCDGLSWADISVFPIYRGYFSTGGFDPFNYSFSLDDILAGNDAQIATLAESSLAADVQVQRVLDEMGIGSALVDPESMSALVASLRTGFELNSWVDESAAAIDVLDRLLYNCVAGRVTKWGKVAIVPFDFTATATRKLGERDFIGVPKVTLTPPDLIVNDLTVFYNLDSSTKEFGSSLTYGAADDGACQESVNRYGLRTKADIQLCDIASADDAQHWASRFVRFFSHQHDVLTGRVPWHVGFGMAEGVVAEITHGVGPNGGWVNERFMLLDQAPGVYGITQNWWRIDYR